MSDATDAPPALAEEPAPAAFKGFVDGLNAQWRIVGWVRPLGEADSNRLQVQLVESENILDTGVADSFRGDLLEANIGDGRFGFALCIPTRLFDGQRHKLTVRLPELAGQPVLGALDMALPHRSARHDQAGGVKTAAGVLRAVLTHRPDAGAYDPDAEAIALTEVLEKIAEAYDHATALGCLYIHVLRRRIDADGLQTRLTRLAQSPGELRAVVREVLASDEACALYRPGAEICFPQSTALHSWTGLRRPN